MARTVHIEMLAGPDVGETYTLSEDSFLVGRGSQCKLQVNSPHVSRQQCEMSWQGDQLVLENLGTVNHTYLNDRPIERVYVQDGDLITFCDIALRVKLPRATPAAPDPDRTVAYSSEQLGAPLPPPQGESTVIRSHPPQQDTHPPGPLVPPGPPPGPPPPRAAPSLPPGVPPRPVPGGLGTGMYGALSGQHQALGGPPPGLPPGMPPGASSSQLRMPPSAGSQGGMPSVPGRMPQGMPSAAPGIPGMAPGMPAMPPGMPAPAPGMPSGRGPGPAAAGGPVQSARKKPSKKRKAKGSKPAPAAGGANLPLIRNVVLVASAVVMLLAFAYSLTDKDKGSKTRGVAPVAETEAPQIVAGARNGRTDQEVIVEAQRLFGIGSTYLREYQIADENLWTSVDYMKRAKSELMVVPPESWPPFAGELDRKIAEAEGLLDQEFRGLKLSYVREKSAGNYTRAMEELDRMMRIFPDKTDERHDFGRKQKQNVERLMRGDKKKGFL